jgi:hypothetical protein
MVKVLNLAVDAANAAIAVGARAAPERIDNTNLVAGFKAQGGRIFHVPPLRNVPGRPKNRGVTFAFRLLKNRIEFATAVQHRNDDFTRKIGAKTAIEHFNNGQTVFFPIHSKTLAALHASLISFARYL